MTGAHYENISERHHAYFGYASSNYPFLQSLFLFQFLFPHTCNQEMGKSIEQNYDDELHLCAALNPWRRQIRSNHIHNLDEGIYVVEYGTFRVFFNM